MTRSNIVARNDYSLPLARPHTWLGFNRFFDELEKPVWKDASYPKYNVIERARDNSEETTTIVEVAVAGFLPNEISVTRDNDILVITGNSLRDNDVNDNYVVKNISSKDFTLKFRLNEYVVVTDATLSNGLLTVYCDREIPEEKKPQEIEINVN